ncbi:NrdH-redoxin [Candidatus Saccharibacteria bacterium 32-49-12]|nr:MAG: NrdH-redoxin [Candidatus Saccharibacteria bacterium 32-49-12]
MSEDTTPTHKDAQVTVYSTSWCAFCHTEMEWLKKLGVEFTAKDIESEPAARDELLSKNGGNFQGVPVTDIAGEMILGFDRPKLEDALRKNGLISE